VLITLLCPYLKLRATSSSLRTSRKLPLVARAMIRGATKVLVPTGTTTTTTTTTAAVLETTATTHMAITTTVAAEPTVLTTVVIVTEWPIRPQFKHYIGATVVEGRIAHTTVLTITMAVTAPIINNTFAHATMTMKLTQFGVHIHAPHMSRRTDSILIGLTILTRKIMSTKLTRKSI
jgi:hypothetical protein